MYCKTILKKMGEAVNTNTALKNRLNNNIKENGL